MAEAVCGEDALELIGQLADKSLIVVDHGPDEVRYRLLETIHEYAAERAAADPDDRAAAAARHTAYWLEFARAADVGIRGPDQLVWAARVEADLDNVRAALDRAIVAGEYDDGIALVLGMGWFWWLRNYHDEAAAWIERLLEVTDLPEDRDHPDFWPRMNLRLLHLFVVSDTVSREVIQGPAMLELASRVIAAYEEPSPHSARFPGMLWPFADYIVGRHDRIREHADTMVASCRRYGGDWELAAALMFRTHITIDLPGGLAHADDDWPELLELSERIGDRWMSAQVCGRRRDGPRLRRLPGRAGGSGGGAAVRLGTGRPWGGHFRPFPDG